MTTPAHSELPVGYKQTEVGVIPQDWEVKTLGEVVNIKKGQSITKKDVKTGEIPVIAGGKNPAYFSDEANRTGKTITVSASGANAGYVSFFTIPIFASDCSTISESSKYSIQFVYYQLKLKQDVIYKSQTGGAQPHIHPVDLAPLKFGWTGLVEQTRIANVLGDVDALIQSLIGLIDKKRQIKRGVMQTLLNPYANGKLKAGWAVKRLGDILEYEQPTKYLVFNTEYNDNNNIPVLTAGKTFILGYTHEEFGVFEDMLPVIIFDDFTTESKFVNFPFKVKSQAMKILKKRDKNVNLRLIFEIMQRIRFPLGNHKRHWIGQYQRLYIYIPSQRAEQTRIAAILSDMDEEITALEAKLAKTQQIKQSMMQNLLTGRIRLVGDAA